MDKYFGFFLCAYGWRNAAVAGELIREAIEIVRPRERLAISGRMPDEVNTLNASIAGDYSDYAERLPEFSRATYVIANRRFPKDGTEINICFEGLSGDYGYALKSYSQSKDSALSFEPREDALVTLTISLRTDIWQHIQHRGVVDKLVKVIETAFVSLDAIYGYGHPIPLPLSGRFSLIFGNSIPAYPRIVDFNYREHIERVCELNFISERQIKGRDFEGPLKAIDGVEVKQLVDLDAKRIQGLAIYLKDYRRSRSPVQEALGDLVWSGKAHAS